MGTKPIIFYLLLETSLFTIVIVTAGKCLAERIQLAKSTLISATPVDSIRSRAVCKWHTQDQEDEICEGHRVLAFKS